MHEHGKPFANASGLCHALRMAITSKECLNPTCRRRFTGPANKVYCLDRCRGQAFRVKQSERPPLVVRNVETVTDADLEAALFEAFSRRLAYGWSVWDLKRILTRVANRLGTDQGRDSHGRFRPKERRPPGCDPATSHRTP